ncbi:hypothetical protein VFPPC_15545 [Pochonia chlamydosporia 170]|uniref:Uncharacterized protein n=1 Tax=Pochonia chlamydosporia 170 TaxID=1380566 RepID=A0A179FYM9_METCM|nr:hypothetical protein VFPPC_15545 [Pochonia chlamydosporia 170]OAQ70153.1 hypothetical protein VFPPC_15545 [Pochonia chlamydosporia 170]
MEAGSRKPSWRLSHHRSNSSQSACSRAAQAGATPEGRKVRNADREPKPKPDRQGSTGTYLTYESRLSTGTNGLCAVFWQDKAIGAMLAELA